MKRYLRFILPTVAVMFVFGAVGVADAKAQVNKLREILTRMDNHNKALTTLRADITMGDKNTQLDDAPEIKVGTVLYAKPVEKDALFRIDWKKPAESLSIINGKYTIYRPRDKSVLTGSAKDATKDPSGDSALAFLKMSNAELKANYTAAYLGEATLSDGTRVVQLQLSPKGKSNYKSAELWIDVNGMMRQAKIIRINNETTLLLTKLEKNISLNSSDFKINYPSGTKEIKS